MQIRQVSCEASGGGRRASGPASRPYCPSAGSCPEPTCTQPKQNSSSEQRAADLITRCLLRAASAASSVLDSQRKRRKGDAPFQTVSSRGRSRKPKGALLQSLPCRSRGLRSSRGTKRSTATAQLSTPVHTPEQNPAAAAAAAAPLSSPPPLPATPRSAAWADLSDSDGEQAASRQPAVGPCLRRASARCPARGLRGRRCTKRSDRTQHRGSSQPFVSALEQLRRNAVGSNAASLSALLLHCQLTRPRPRVAQSDSQFLCCRQSRVQPSPIGDGWTLLLPSIVLYLYHTIYFMLVSQPSSLLFPAASPALGPVPLLAPPSFTSALLPRCG